MGRTWMKSATLNACAALVAAAAGCGSDSSGQGTTETAASVPTVTSPLETTLTQSSTASGQKSGPETSASGGVGPGACAIPDAFQNLKYTGVGCTDAVAVAQAWDANGKDCNTVDNPNVDEGYRRTCEVEGYSCTAKRDVHSDGRFVSCTQGGNSVRFTWLPA